MEKFLEKIRNFIHKVFCGEFKNACQAFLKNVDNFLKTRFFPFANLRSETSKRGNAINVNPFQRGHCALVVAQARC